MTDIDYAAGILARKFNTYFVAEGDGDYNIRLQSIVPANPCCNCYSVAKAFTVTAVGILYDRGLLTTDTLVTDVLSDLLPYNIDPKWHKVKLHHLMLHKVGFDHSMLDIDVEDASQYPSSDYLHIVLSEPLAHEPGTHYQYTDAAFYLLSRVIAKVKIIVIKDGDITMKPCPEYTIRRIKREELMKHCPVGTVNSSRNSPHNTTP